MRLRHLFSHALSHSLTHTPCLSRKNFKWNWKEKHKENLHPPIETRPGELNSNAVKRKKKRWTFVFVCHFVYNIICFSSFLLCSSQIYHNFSFVVSTKNTIVTIYIYLFCFVLFSHHISIMCVFEVVRKISIVSCFLFWHIQRVQWSISFG